MTRPKSKETNVSAPAGPNDDPAHLAEKINQELEKGQEHSRLLVEHMIRLGDLLIQAKESVGHGQVILFAADPTFRGYFEGSARLFLNAVLLGPGMGASTPLPW